MATHSSIVAWRIPWAEEPGGLQSVVSQRVGHNWARTQHNSHLKKTTTGVTPTGISEKYLPSGYLPTARTGWGDSLIKLRYAHMPFTSKCRLLETNISQLTKSREIIPVLEIQSSLGKPPSTKSKLHQTFITYKSFLEIGSHPAATLLPVFSHFCSSIRKFNSYSLSEEWTSRYKSRDTAKLLSYKMKPFGCAQPWIFVGRTDADPEAEALILWPSDANTQLTGKDPDAGKDWR